MQQKNSNERESKKRRDEALFACYVKKLKEHGDYAKFIPKHILYQEVAEIFFVSERTAYQAIKGFITNGNQESILTQEEINSILAVHEGFKQNKG